jgi:magnesium transporter
MYKIEIDGKTIHLHHSINLFSGIDVDGIHYQYIIQQLADRYNIHSLVQQDIILEQRTKLDVLDDALFLVCKLMYRDINHPEKTVIQQISFYLKENILITFQETPKDLFDSIKSKIPIFFEGIYFICYCFFKDRIRQSKGRVRRSKIDYLFYSLVDVIVDNYMEVLDRMGSKVEAIDNQLMKTLKRDTLEAIYDLKRDMLYLRSIISPLKEIIIKLQKEEETQIMQESTTIYLKDLFDHVVQVNDAIDTYREMLASFIDFYMMLNSNAMNQVVKTLTIISTIFIPLTFICGVYGMVKKEIFDLKKRNFSLF